MPDYRIIASPGALKGVVISADEEGLKNGADAAIGLDTPPDQPDAQLDIRYRGGNTFVSLAVEDEGRRVPREHWRFIGAISPEDCRANWMAAQERAAKIVTSSKIDANGG